MDPLPPPPDDLEDSDLQQAMRNARPSWATDGHGVRGPQPARHSSEQPLAKAPHGAVVREPRQPSFPDLAEDQPTAAAAVAPETNTYSFKGEVDSIDLDAGTVDIHVGYGEINDTPPDGMTGADDYILTISVDGTEIYAVVTYDTNTLAITSRSIGFGASVPDSTADIGTGVGTLYIPLIAVDIAYDVTTGKIKEVVVRNRHCGDIVFVIMYGSVNGQAAFIPVPTLADWTAAFPP